MRFDRWDIAGFDRDGAKELCAAGINPLVAVLLASRGMTNPDDVKTFLDTGAAPFHDPFLMTDMDKAVRRIKDAIGSDELIAIYGDYDVDGMTSAALFALWLESKGARYELSMSRRGDGYGLGNFDILDKFKEQGAGLAVTVDINITSTPESVTQHAKDIGLDMIIADHHECGSFIPNALAYINPKRPDCSYPFDDLAGVGVVFKMICALEGDYLSGETIDRYSQLAALGTVADVMPVTGENRKLILHGLKSINENPVAGLKRLISEACSEPAAVTAETIGYVLAPRLNAAGRMSDPLLSVKLLLSKSYDEAGQYAAELVSLNDDRRILEQEVFDKVLEQLGSKEPDVPIVLAGRGWPQGVTGIVASKVADRFRLPSVIISIDEDGVGRGSCRSGSTFSIFDALSSCSDILIKAGGHNMAAGFDVKEENIDELRERIEAYYRAHAADITVPGLEVDFVVDKPRLLAPENVEALSCLEPFGRGNPQPRLCIKGALLTALTPVGAGKHSKLKVSKDGSLFDCIFFSAPPERLGVITGDTVDIVFQPQINEYRGRRSVQLQLTDIKKQ